MLKEKNDIHAWFASSAVILWPFKKSLYLSHMLSQDYNDEIRQEQLRELSYLNGSEDSSRGRGIRGRGIRVPPAAPSRCEELLSTLAGPAFANGGSVLEPAVTGSDEHGEIFWQLLTEATPVALLQSNSMEEDLGVL
ncbi:hypothetical protein DUI87_10989 [Hirundo rustica rustica]|uniref:Uncharacterized protein n=1 Tax=Hirundo rustica rustica TaxID=333673 RepID=A0A3M0KLC9_HIRRU|nr:hypothetical protein DUI87_10989 [Hirundo rustica rustica]